MVDRLGSQFGGQHEVSAEMKDFYRDIDLEGVMEYIGSFFWPGEIYTQEYGTEDARQLRIMLHGRPELEGRPICHLEFYIFQNPEPTLRMLVLTHKDAFDMAKLEQLVEEGLITLPEFAFKTIANINVLEKLAAGADISQLAYKMHQIYRRVLDCRK